MAMHICFDAKLITRSDKGDFPSDTIAAVYVTNRDGCTFREVPVDKNGMLRVDFEMKPVQSGIKLTDRVKLHFFFRDNKDQLLKPVCSGHMTLVELADKVKDGGEFCVGSNFTNNSVTVKFDANADHSRNMHLDLLKLYQTNGIVKSVLSDSAKHLQTIQELDQHVQNGLGENTEILNDNGGSMFRSLFTAHMMENEATLYSLYAHDFDEPHTLPPFLCTYMIAETLNHNGWTIDQVKAMNPRGVTDFIASYAQAPMRGASTCPYFSDETLTDDPSQYQQNRRTMMSEVFNRPYSHPYHLFQNKRGTLITDDCEGLALILMNLTNHLGYLYSTHSDDFNRTTHFLSYNTLMKRYFPEDMFKNMSAGYQNKLMELAMFLGERVANKTIECKITLVSANAPAMGAQKQGETEIQAHACACMVCNDPKFPHAVILEGTACVADDQMPKKIQLGDELVSLTDVVNTLSVSPPFNTFFEKEFETKVAIHMTHSKSSFYRTAFCQNDILIGSQSEGQKLTFGVDMENLADDGIKVYMPVTGKLLKDKNAYADLVKYVGERRCEIHLPLVDHDELRAKLNWVPIQPFKGCKELDSSQPYVTCMVHVLADEKHPLDQLLERATKEANEFNSNLSYGKLGVMRAFACMDGVSKLLHIYTNDTTELSKRLIPVKA